MNDAGRHIDWQYLDNDVAVRVGDTISAAAGGLPIYRVMAISNGRVWLKDEDNDADRVMPLNAFHWKAHWSRV